ncbi:hypothetical protein GTN66_00685, partial [bacterium]|nr:hypothetical protein [bacterium]NIO18173.1 hypothetical protein [bacterium]NIO72926.1 hypothetical protein [bacterium]
SFSKERILQLALSPYDYYCTGYSPGNVSYINTLVMGAGSFKETFSHAGSKVLDSIVAYDEAEVSGANVGQINMSLVSSFCGPQGLVWGYDIAKEESLGLPSYLSPKSLKKFKGVKIRNGENLRKASKALLGTVNKQHFPFLPGSHVPCAGRFRTKSGPTTLYGAIAIGIPKDRSRSACLFMEDTGEISGSDGDAETLRERLCLSAIQSVLEVGKNQKVNYHEIFIDFISKEVSAGEVGCVLVVVPYLLIARKALT